MAKPHERVFALVGALLFLGTAVATAVVVVLQSHQQSQVDKTTQAAQQALQQQVSQEGKLQGTQLNNYTPVPKVDSLQKIDIKEGTGNEVKPDDTVTVHYTGAVAATGVIFQSSHDSG